MCIIRRPPLQTAWEALQIFGSSLHMIATAWGAVLCDMLYFFLGPPARALLGFFKVILELVMPIFRVCCLLQIPLSEFQFLTTLAHTISGCC